MGPGLQSEKKLKNYFKKMFPKSIHAKLPFTVSYNVDGQTLRKNDFKFQLTAHARNQVHNCSPDCVGCVVVSDRFDFLSILQFGL